MKTLQYLFYSCVEKYGHLEAIVTDHKRIRYKELQEQVFALQKGLRKMGIEAGKTIGLLLPNSIEFIVSYFAIINMGNKVVPLNPMLTSEELTYICKDASIQTVICHSRLEGLIAQLKQKAPDLHHIVVVPSPSKSNGNHWISYTDLIAQNHNTTPLETSIDPEEVAAILYTSGTTGKPKGAMLTHKNLYSNTWSSYKTLGCSEKDCFLVALPLFHAFQATVGMLIPLIAGCKMVILSEFKPATVLELIEKENLTIFLGVPSMYLLLTRGSKENQAPQPFFRLCVSGGAALPVSVAQEFRQKFNLPIHEGYGLTEASPVCSVNPIDQNPKLGSIGLPIEGVQMKVVDENLNELPKNSVGELAVKGDNVMKGYLGLPEETAQTIRDGWLLTGDMARQDEEGYFYIVDRKKEMIIVAGENVYPREVEEVLYAHQAIAEAAVIGIPDELRGEVPKAFIRLKENITLTKKEILNFCKERLATYKIPRQINFIESFPKNATGKILKKELVNSQ